MNGSHLSNLSPRDVNSKIINQKNLYMSAFTIISWLLRKRRANIPAKLRILTICWIILNAWHLMALFFLRRVRFRQRLVRASNCCRDWNIISALNPQGSRWCNFWNSNRWNIWLTSVLYRIQDYPCFMSSCPAKNVFHKMLCFLHNLIIGPENQSRNICFWFRDCPIVSFQFLLVFKLWW